MKISLFLDVLAKNIEVKDDFMFQFIFVVTELILC